MAVVSAAFLLAVNGAFCRVHIEHDTLGLVLRLGLSDQLAVDRHQPKQVLFTGQQLCLEALQTRRKRPAAFPVLFRAEQAKGRIGGDSHGIVEILVACEAAVDRLPHQIDERKLLVCALSRIRQMLVDQLAQSEPLVQFPKENQATIRGDARSFEIDFEKSVEGELKRLVFFFTHWVLASVRPDRARSPINKDAEDRWKVGMPKSNWKCG